MALRNVSCTKNNVRESQKRLLILSSQMWWYPTFTSNRKYPYKYEGLIWVFKNASLKNERVLLIYGRSQKKKT